MIHDIQPAFEALLADLELDQEDVLFVEEGKAPPADCLSSCLVINHIDLHGKEEEVQHGLKEGGCLLVFRGEEPSNQAMAAFRNHLWPRFHVPAFYLFQQGKPPLRKDLDGNTRLEQAAPVPVNGYVAVAVGRDQVFSPEAVTSKFNRNAPGWNGDPGSPSYGHFRWMRRIMAEVAAPRSGTKLLDAGCGAGWVGLEAALMGAQVSAFDPSPEMTRIVASNAEELGLDLDVKVGFAEAPPFNGPFETVISSGVVSFAPDRGAFFNGIDSVLERHGTLVVGDLNHGSSGMAHRRKNNPVLPMRELNALTRDQVLEELKKRAYKIEKVWFYQLTRPIPQLMHLSETHLGGLGSFTLLMFNKAAHWLDALLGSFASRCFDSYIVKARKHGPPVA